MSKKDNILRKRKSAGHVNVSTPDDQTAIVEMIPLDGMLIVVKEAGIYQFQFADQVDPGRTNINLPNVLQKLLGYGAQDEFVGRIFLTAKRLLKTPHIPDIFDHKLALNLSLKILTEVAGLRDIRLHTHKEIERGLATTDQHRVGALMLPTIRDLKGQIHSFVLRADHCRQHLLDLIKVFYGDELANFDDVTKALVKRHGSDCPLVSLFDELSTLSKFIRNARHCVEHRRADQRLEIRDFSLGQNGQTRAPTIEIVHKETAEPQTDLIGFMELIESSLIEAAETLIIHLCGWNCGPVGGIKFDIVEIPLAKRGKSFVRYTFGMQLKDQLIMF